MTKDTRTKRTVETTYTPAEFLATLADHVPDRYRHNVRYFGLLAPRAKSQTHDAVFALLGQGTAREAATIVVGRVAAEELRGRSARDRDGQRMRWVRRELPAAACGRVSRKPALAPR